ncbi:hypothetical protein OsI_28485 [Oryza sativa Indica Group]|uniref:Uncharacterized protein n=1 Tax=Oryza sativa subsp. indica TaxID=39946 RepID=B8B8X4_ORYSI|nr:hypothetical protein OsI_28485 [Oryza sativa Indica Group]
MPPVTVVTATAAATAERPATSPSPSSPPPPQPRPQSPPPSPQAVRRCSLQPPTPAIAAREATVASATVASCCHHRCHHGHQLPPRATAAVASAAAAVSPCRRPPGRHQEPLEGIQPLSPKRSDPGQRAPDLARGSHDMTPPSSRCRRLLCPATTVSSASLPARLHVDRRHRDQRRLLRPVAWQASRRLHHLALGCETPPPPAAETAPLTFISRPARAGSGEAGAANPAAVLASSRLCRHLTWVAARQGQRCWVVAAAARVVAFRAALTGVKF